MISFRLRAKKQNCRGYVPRYERTPKNGWFDIHSVFATHVETVVLLSRNSTVHYMQLNPEPYEMIKNGQKTIELRLFDEKRRKVKMGDEIVFTNTSNGRTLHVVVSRLHRCDTFEELYESLPLLKCGYTAETIAKASPTDMGKYYSAEDQKKYGVVGIEIFQPKETSDEVVY